MLRRICLTAAVFSATLVALPADAFTARNGARVNPVNSAVFEVVPSGSSAGQSIWCAASQYARRTLKAGWQSQVYVARGMGPSETTNRRSAVQFTIDPGAAGITPTGGSHSLNSFVVGDHMSVQQADRFCEEQPTW